MYINGSRKFQFLRKLFSKHQRYPVHGETLIMNEIWEKIRLIYEHLDYYKCLCSFSNNSDIRDVWLEVYQNSFGEIDIVKKEECQMLCISFIRLTGEIFTSEISYRNHICEKILHLHEVFTSDEYWKIFIHNVKSSKNNYLVWNFIKSFSISLYTCSESNFSSHIHELVDDIKDSIFHKGDVHILDFISNLVDYNFNSLSNCEANVCKKVTPSSISSSRDLFQSLSVILSKDWNIFVNQFHEVIASNSENQSINRFLILWKNLLEKLHAKDLFHTFLNEQHVVAFFSNAHDLSVISLQIYVDVIMQFFTSSSKFALTEGRGNKSLEQAVSSALDNDFLNKLPSDVQVSGSCALTKFSERESLADAISSGLDPVIARKISFIFINALIGTRDKDLLCNAVEKIHQFVKYNFSILPEVPFHKCVLDIFIDQDDILFGMMLAFLRIHITFKEGGDAEDARPFKYEKLQSDLNPHEFFIAFLERIGFDHNELLSFLTSDETPFLMYLLQYLKLLLQEWGIFIKAHQTIIKSYSNVYQSDAAKQSCKPPLSYTPPSKISLVSYSSSSSSDEETNSFAIAVDKSDSSSKDFIVIQTLVKLKLAIQKLSDLNEFPYNAAPLIALLAACQEHSLML